MVKKILLMLDQTKLGCNVLFSVSSGASCLRALQLCTDMLSLFSWRRYLTALLTIPCFDLFLTPRRPISIFFPIAFRSGET